MPNKLALIKSIKIRKMSLLSSIAILFVSFLALNFHNKKWEQPEQKNLASLNDKSEHFLTTDKHKIFHHHQKIKAPISISLQRLEQNPIEPQIPFTLIAKIKTTVSTPSAKIFWNLPQWVTLVSGEIETTLTALTPGEEIEIHITLMVNSNENVQIHAQVKAPFGATLLADTAQFNTLMEQEFREQKELLVQRNKEYLEK